MFNGGKDKRLLFKYSGEIYQITKCIYCGKDLTLGHFAYDQNMCWECFKNRVSEIMDKISPAEDREIIRHLFKITEEVFRRNRNE